MFSKESLDATGDKLLNFSPKKKSVDLEKYKNSIDTTFNCFFSDVKKQPHAKQLKFIEENLKKQLPLDKRQHFLFFLATIATVRDKSLTENHPEKKLINELLSLLSDGFINGFTASFKIPRIELIQSIVEGFDSWVKAYEIDDPEMSYNALLAFYCMACFLETQLSNPLVPKEASSGLKNLKMQIEQQFTQLINEHGNSLKNSESSHSNALQQLAPEKIAYEQFKENLASIKERQAKIERLIQWKELSSKYPNRMDVFWAHYRTEQLFDELMNDLEIEEDQRKDLKPFFYAEHGEDRFTKIKGEIFVGLPKFVGGTSTNAFPLQLIGKKTDEALQKLGVNSKKYQSPIQLIKEIEAAFNQLKDIEKKDIQILKAHQSQIKSAKGIKEDTLDVVVGDINAFQRHLVAQEQYVLHLQEIHTKILALKDRRIETDGLLGPFEKMLEHAIKTVPHGDKQIDRKTPEEKIKALLEGVRKTQTDATEIGVQIQKNVGKIRNLALGDSKDAILHATALFIQKHEKNFLHKILCFFSKTYKEMFESLNEAVKENDITRVVSILVGKAEEQTQTCSIAMLFDETQELQTLKTTPANNG
ncbi:hypothetical protein ACTAZI_00600 [Legionella bozemanae]|uniref:hypothetical protein n=1 Tax=Legionella bozemanae TaxID=447 RepID=UPI00399D37A2